MTRRFILTLALLFYGRFYAHAQGYVLQHFTRQDGISNNNVFRTFQDSKGFIWHCTYGGLIRFDGKTFHHFDDLFTNTPVLSVSETDKSELLACSYSHGLFLFENGRPVQLTLPRDTLPIHTLYALQSKNTIWFIAKSEYPLLYRINNKQLQQVTLLGSDNTPVRLNKLIRDGNKILIATSQGVYSAEDTVIHRLFQELGNDEVTDIRKSSADKYWIAFKHRIIAIQNGTIVHNFSIPGNKTINNILPDKKGNVWVSLQEGGILLINNNKLSDVSSRFTIDGTIINDIFEDRDGNIWLSTYTDGIYRLNTVAILNYNKGNAPISIYCSAITRLDSNRILLGSNGKINIWENGTIKPLPLKLLQSGYFINFLDIIGEKLYIGTAYGMIEKHLTSPFSERYIPSVNKEDPVFGTLCFLKDSKNRMWVGGFTALFRLIDGQLVRQSDPLLNRRYNTIYETPEGNILFGTDSGMIVYDGHRYRHHFLGNKREINAIHCFYTDQQNRLWITTIGGIVCMEKNKYRVITIGKGFLTNRCKDIIPYNKEKLLVACYDGLMQLDIRNDQIREFPTGLNQSEVLKLFVADSNTIFVGNTEGMFTIDKAALSETQHRPTVYVTAVKIADSTLYMPDSIQLHYKKNRLTIEFTALNYSNSYNINYRYRILGSSDNQWQFTANNSIEIPSLPPGDYQLLINARNGQADWGTTARLAIYIPAPFWRQTWFIVLNILISAITVWLISRFIVLKTEQKKREQLSVYNKIVYLKQQALSALMNPHFIFNCMNSIQHFMNKNENALANSYLSDFSDLIRMTLEDAQSAFIPLDKEISRINLYLSLERLRFGEDLHYAIHKDQSLNIAAIQIPNMILQPYIENAIWHGIMPKDGEGMINISFLKQNEHQMVITIEDNGVGLNHTKQKRKENKQDWGIKLTKQRLSLLQALLHQYYNVIVQEKTENSGTVVTITLPLQPDEQMLQNIETEATGDPSLSQT